MEKVKKNEIFLKILNIFLEIALDGVVLNFMVFSVFGLAFTWYSWLGWGFIPYILGEIIPRLFVKYKKRVN